MTVATPGNVLVAIQPVVAEPLGLTVTGAADAIVMYIQAGRTRLAAAQRTIDSIAHERDAGALLFSRRPALRHSNMRLWAAPPGSARSGRSPGRRSCTARSRSRGSCHVHWMRVWLFHDDAPRAMTRSADLPA